MMAPIYIIELDTRERVLVWEFYENKVRLVDRLKGVWERELA